jgi:peptide/nickel transport system substrate-binding protein
MPTEPTPRRPRAESLRALVEIGAFTVLAVVVLVLLGLVLARGRGSAAPPPGTLVVAQTQSFPSLDPALAQSDEAWELEYSTCAKLLNYAPRKGYAGTRLVPEVAATLPRISRDRLTYRFTIRRGWRFSNGERVTARAFARALARGRLPELLSPAASYLREVSAWSVRGRTLTIKLHQPAPDFPQRLALPYFCAVPPWAPDEPTNDLPSAGPFMIAHFTPGRSILLRRNPYYRGPRRPHVDSILYRFGAPSSQILLELERGEVDYGVVSAVGSESLQRRFGRDRSHLFVVQQPTVAYLALNTQRPLFRDNPQLRRAVNYALDRPNLVRQFGLGGAAPADEYLPPGFPGYRRRHIYPLDGPDLATARRLARGHLRGGHAVFLACGTEDCKNRALVVADSLRKIGLDVRLKMTTGLLTLASVKGTKFDIADVITKPDYGDPYALIDKLLDGRVIRSVANTNISYYSDPHLDAEIDRAQRMTGVARDRAYGRLGIEVARRDAPLAAYAVLNARVFVSQRVGCVTYQPVYGLDLAGICLARRS